MASALAVEDRLRTHRERGEFDLTGYPTELVVFLRVNSSGSVMFSDLAETWLAHTSTTALPTDREHATTAATRRHLRDMQRRPKIAID